MLPPPMLQKLPRRISLLVRGVTAAAACKHPNIFSYSLGPDSGSSSSSSTRSRSSRRFSSNAEQSTRSRRWCYDEAQFDGDYDDEEGSSFGGSASWDQAFDEPWFAKVSRAYWYVLPLILASMLLATGPQAFLLAMAVPIAQSAASFAIRAFSSTFGRNQEDYDDDDDYYDYRSSGWEASEEQGYNSTYSTKYRQGSSSSRSQQQQTWAKDDMSEVSEPSEDPDGTDVFSASSSNSSRTGFGGWDELDGAGDDQCITSSKRRAGVAPPPDAAADNTATGGAERSLGRRRPKPETTTRRRKPSSRAAARYRQSPLLMRLLVAVFPFLGSWFRIMR